MNLWSPVAVTALVHGPYFIQNTLFPLHGSVLQQERIYN